jgi:hypothetical protein
MPAFITGVIPEVHFLHRLTGTLSYCIAVVFKDELVQQAPEGVRK